MNPKRQDGEDEAELQAARSGVAVATVLYRPDPQILDALLTPLEAQGLRIVIFINGAVDEGVEQRLARLGNAALIRSSDNIGLGAGLNAVVEAAAKEGFGHVLLFDQDSTPTQNLAARLLARMDRAGATATVPPAVIGPLLVAPATEGFLAPWYARRFKTAGPTTEVDFLPTSGSLVSVEAFAEVGPFRADYFIDGIDVEWCFRAWARGYSCLLAEDLEMVHRWGSQDGQTGGSQILRQSDLRTFYYLRNATESLRLHHIPLRWKARVASRTAAQIALLLANRGFDSKSRRLVTRAVSDGWRGRLGPME